MTELTIITIYFVFVLGVGVYSAFKIKKPDEYYVAGKKAGLLSVSGSLLATILGGSAILGTIELSQNIGWAALWFLFCAAFGLFVLIPFSKKVSRFGNFTLPELLKNFYGKNAEVIASVIIPIAWLGIVAAKILSGLEILNYSNAAIISGTVFIVYTLLGGQLSILKTDSLQSVLIIFGLVALMIFALSGNQSQIEPLKFHSLFNTKFTVFDLFILMLTYSITFVVGPDIYSRIFCAKNEVTAKKAVLFVGIILVPISFLLTYLGVFSTQTGNPGIISFAENLLPAWIYGLFIAALLSAVMSSADTTLLTSSMILAEIFTRDLNKKSSMKTTRILVVFIGILSILTALFVTSIIQSLLFALTFFSGAFAVPILIGLLQIQVKRNRIVPAIILGGLVALSGKIITVFQHDTIGKIIIVCGFLVNAAILFFPETSASRSNLSKNKSAN